LKTLRSVAEQKNQTQHYNHDDLVIFVGHSSDARQEAESVGLLSDRIQQELNGLNRIAGPGSPFKVVEVFLSESKASPDVGQRALINQHLERADICVFVFRERVGKITWVELEYSRTRMDKSVPAIAVVPNASPSAQRMVDRSVAEAWVDLLARREELVSDWNEENSKSLLPMEQYQDLDHLQEIVFAKTQNVLHGRLRNLQNRSICCGEFAPSIQRLSSVPRDCKLLAPQCPARRRCRRLDQRPSSARPATGRARTGKARPDGHAVERLTSTQHEKVTLCNYTEYD